MKRSLLILFLAGFIGGLCHAQRPAPSLGDSLRDEGDLKSAIEAYSKQYWKTPDDRNNTYNYACALSLNQQIDSAFHYLNIATANDSVVQVLRDADFYYLIKDERWKKLETEVIERVEAKFGKYENLELSKELWQMLLLDQAFYYQIDIADKKLERGSPVTRALWELKGKINDTNVKRITEIIDTQGWPKSSVVKGSAASAVFLVIQHADIKVQEKYLPVMKEAANAGEARWSSLALLIDRVNLKQGKKQIYGSQMSRGDDGKFKVSDLEEPEYVNERREEVGLGPIEDYVKHWNVEWTVEQKQKKKRKKKKRKKKKNS